MLKRPFMLILGLSAVFSLAGCVTAKTYVVNKPRVDQDIPGLPSEGPVKTRQVVVLELIDKDKAGSKSAPDVATQASDHDSEGSGSTVSAEEKNFDLPQGSVPAAKSVESQAVPQEYVVEKDDTLQKISKKVYGSYSKWTKIYDANRDVLKDPNFLKPGLKIKIPQI
jgi:nucleoid-associated protein YgaU